MDCVRQFDMIAKMFSCVSVRILFLLFVVLYANDVVLCAFPNELQDGAEVQNKAVLSEDYFLTHHNPFIALQRPGQDIQSERSHSKSGEASAFSTNKDSGSDRSPEYFPEDDEVTAVKSNHSKIDVNQTYSVTSPFGIYGRPLLTGNTKSLRGYKAHPQSNSVMQSRPFDAPVRQHSEFGVGVHSNNPQSGMQWAINPFWDSRRMSIAERSSSMHQNPGGRGESEQNQELVRSILTQALDILTQEPMEKRIECRNNKGFKIPCGRSDSDSFQSMKVKDKLGSTNTPCEDGQNNRNCRKMLSYHDIFSPWLQKFQTAYQSRLKNENTDTEYVREPGLNGNRDLPKPRTRTVFRSVETSPTSSLARLFNTDDSTSNGGGGGDSHGSGSTTSSNTGAGNTGNHNSGNGAGSSGGGSVDSPRPVGVDQNVFNKFAREVVSFEQQSASEIKRLDNLLRQLAMAAQTDFTTVTSNVNALQQELVQTQRQLVQAWSILNATHVKDNLQTSGDLHDVKTDVYRLHALMTGTTPLGQGTAHGRAAEVKEMATIGPGVDCAALYKSGVNTSGVYDLQPQPADNGTRMTAFCDMETDGGGWTVFQRRRDGSDDFFRGWNSYKHGFGSYRHDHWLGLENIHLLTKYGDNVMRIELTDWDNKTRWAEFSYTRIMDESDGYRILVGGYRGTAGDPFHSISYSMRMQSMRFSTFDSDNDLDSGGNCALTFTSGWWFNKCFQVNLNGVWYGNSRYAGPSMNGIVWDLWPEHFNGYSLKHTEMKLRPADFFNKK